MLGTGFARRLGLGLLLLARWGASQERGPAPLRWLSTHVRGAWSAVIGLTIAGLIFLVVLNIPGGPLKAVCEVRYVSRTCTLFSLGEGTNAVRALIWEGVIDMMSPHAPLQSPDGQPDAFNIVRPLAGYGPESLWVAFNRFYPPELGRFEARNAITFAEPDNAKRAVAQFAAHELAAVVPLPFAYQAVLGAQVMREPNHPTHRRLGDRSIDSTDSNANKHVGFRAGRHVH